MERWRTRALLGALVVIGAAGLAAAVLAQTDDSAGPSKPVTRPQLSAVGQGPLTVEGVGFRRGERVRVVAKGSGASASAIAHAGRRGRFRVVLRGVKGCDSLDVTAVGSKGSKASFNLSSFACIEP